MCEAERAGVTSEAKDLFDNYAEYNRILRTWFVAYGIGGPVLFLMQDKVLAAIKASGSGRMIAGAFLTGVAAQVLVAIINKWSTWYVYRDAEEGSAGAHRIAHWFTDQFWIDMACDIVSLVAFAFATFRVLAVSA